MQYLVAIAALITVFLLFTYHGHHPAAAPPQPAATGQSYYEQVFNYAMDNLPAGSHFDWKTYNAGGSIAVAKAFVSKSGSTCRSFSERYSILGSVPVSDTGYGCRRAGRPGWCRLTPNDALTCALESPYYHVNLPGPMITGTPNLPDINISAPSLGTDDSAGTDLNVSNPRSNGGKPSATDAANTITGTAGSVAGYVAKNAGSWFSNLFR